MKDPGPHFWIRGRGCWAKGHRPSAGVGTCTELDAPVAKMKGNFLLGSFGCRIF